MPLFAELKRRNVFKVAVAYLALAWLVVQITATVAPAFHLPESALPLVTWIAVIGLPFVLVFAWVFEITPEGIKRESEIDRASSTTQHTGRKLDYVIIALLVAAIAVTLLDRTVAVNQGTGSAPAAATSRSTTAADDAHAPAPTAAGGSQLAPGVSGDSDGGAHSATAPAAGTDATGGSATPAPHPRSIAVLPFVNMSSDKEQEFFSDGIAEELLNLLTKVPGLRVTSRSSAFSFKGKDLELTEIARRLNVAHVLEGSVRKSGNKVRVTAQLIDMRSDTHLWSETWDREMTDIFAVQDEIAAAVVAQLKITLLGAAPKTRATNPQAYALFLQARQLGRQFTVASSTQSNALYEQALKLDPDYAAALDGIATNYINQAAIGLIPIEEAYRQAREYVRREFAIDPDYALAHDNLGWIAMAYDLDMAAAVRHFEHALALEPANLDIIGHTAVMMQALGRIEQAMAIQEFTIARDPVNLAAMGNLGDVYLRAGRLDDAKRVLGTVLQLSPERIGGRAALGFVELLRGDTAAALELVTTEGDEISRLLGIAQVRHTLGEKAASDEALARAIDAYGGNSPYYIATTLAWRGEIDRTFEWLDRAARAHDPNLFGLPTQVEFRELRKDPRWLPYLRKLNMAPEQLDAIPFEVKLPE